VKSSDFPETLPYHFDVTGSTRALSDNSEVVTDDAVYSASGHVIALGGAETHE